MRTTERLLQSCVGIGWAGGQDLRCVNQQPCWQKMTSILCRTTVSSFLDYAIIPRTFILN